MEKKETVDLHLTLDLTGEGENRDWNLSEWLIDEHHSGFTRALQADCEAAGLQPISDMAPMFPANISERFGPAGVNIWLDNLGKYHTLSRLHQVRNMEAVSVESGMLELQLSMPTHSVRLLRLKP